MLDHLLDPDVPRRSNDPDDRNPNCAECAVELWDGELHNKQDGELYCDECWQNFPACVKCEEMIIGEVAVEEKMLVMRTGKYDTWHFHESCHSDWKAEEGGDYEPFGDGWRERVTQ